MRGHQATTSASSWARWRAHTLRVGRGTRPQASSLVSYLEKPADILEAPALATQDKLRLVGGALVWPRRISPALKDQWQPLTG
ncbi:hypothetical protein OHA79_01485 [Streptomyces sp. NBC_00841]|uniref:hypothetical protein n=1 Tax=Streptomyces sp. NBC_00841 TaxID=2975847 RepID=UPI002DD7D6D0|nr:hypothetical protein [Streptomyces sp. NBC_00841]WRZ96735.1 hypothetical protein OHA79_01485 [Streptomyces sp. NBC_00841]